MRTASTMEPKTALASAQAPGRPKGLTKVSPLASASARALGHQSAPQWASTSETATDFSLEREAALLMGREEGLSTALAKAPRWASTSETAAAPKMAEARGPQRETP